MRSAVDTALSWILPPVVGGAAVGLSVLLSSRRTSGWAYRRRWLVLPAGCLVGALLVRAGWEVGERRANVATAVGGTTLIALGFVFFGILTLFLRDIVTGVPVTTSEPVSDAEREAIRVPRP
jgi:hypothetical protein